MSASSRLVRTTVLLAGVVLLVSAVVTTGGGLTDVRSGSAAAAAATATAAPSTSPATAGPPAGMRSVSEALGGLPRLPSAEKGASPRESEPAAAAVPVPHAAAPASAQPVANTPLAPLAPVVTQQPRLHVEVVAGDAEEVAARIRALPGVAAAAGIVRATVPVGGLKGPTAVTVAAVDPMTFRPLTPQSTADSTAVWERLLDGDAAFTHDAATRLALRLGSSVPAADTGLLRVGAFASNGVPPVADVIVTHQTAAQLGVVGEGGVLVAAAAGVAPKELAEAIAAVTGREPTVLAEPRARRAFLTGSDTSAAFEPFAYVDNGDGLIQIDPEWVGRNIVNAEVPILRGTVRCHRLLVEQLRGALAELESLGLASLIDPSQYGGCHVARHIDFDPSKPLSMHAWGLAVDLNVSTNGLGQKPQMDPRVVQVFERWGFVWGGRWSRPDGMHFELGALLESPRG